MARFAFDISLLWFTFLAICVTVSLSELAPEQSINIANEQEWCPSPWVEIPGAKKCYQLLSWKSAVDWSTQRKECKAQYPSGDMNVDLAAFDTDHQFYKVCRAIQSGVLGPYQRNTYIGLNDIEQEGHYVWSKNNKTKFKPFPWGPNQPNDRHGHPQDCAVIHITTCIFNDFGCYDEHVTSGLCELSKPEICPLTDGPCDQICTPTGFDSHRCSCWPGYEWNPDTDRCQDIDECANPDTRVCFSLCVNTVGSFRCACTNGYTLDVIRGTDCQDINECYLDNGGCMHKCMNTVGSFYCYCYTGFQMNNNKLCVGTAGERKSKAVDAIIKGLCGGFALSMGVIWLVNAVVCSVMTFVLKPKQHSSGTDLKKKWIYYKGTIFRDYRGPEDNEEYDESSSRSHDTSTASSNSNSGSIADNQSESERFSISAVDLKQVITDVSQESIKISHSSID